MARWVVGVREVAGRGSAMWSRSVITALGLVVMGMGHPMAAATPIGISPAQLPPPTPPFAGTIEIDARDSKPAYPPPVQAPKGAPNILLIMTDDEAFGATNAFGGAIPTPNLDALADKGLRYTQFHTTAMCSPTRAALLTGRNHHAAGTGSLTNYATGYPGYTSIIPNSTASVAQVLRMNGYNTAMFGKHHNVPLWQSSASGTFDEWPTGLGFEYFFGFIGSDTDQFHPGLYRGTTRVEVPEDGKLLGERLSDDAIRWVHNQKAADPDKPFLLYMAPGAGHAPAQAPAEFLARFKGRFDSGWDNLREEIVARQKAQGIIPTDARSTPRPDTIPAWSSLTADQKRIAARFMEAYAAALAYEDEQIGRLIAELKRMGQWENTLVLYLVGDNGADSQGGARGLWNELGAYGVGTLDTDEERLAAIDTIGSANSYSLHPVGWSWAMNAPFPYFKQFASHLGGTRNGLVVSWPARLGQKTGIRSQFAHVTDIAPTIYEAAGIRTPTSVNGAQQKPLAGTSLIYSFADAGAPTRHRTQYFELLGNRAIYHDGWWANTEPQVLPWTYDPSGSRNAGPPPASQFKWELYDLSKDFTQSHDLASARPDKLREMQALWMREAKQNDVLPLDPAMGAERAAAMGRPTGQSPRKRWVLWGKGTQLDWDNAPMLGYCSFTLDAKITVPTGGGEGVIAASGSNLGGWTFFLDHGRPVAVQALGIARSRVYRIAADALLSPGEHKLRYRFTRDQPGSGGSLDIEADGETVAQGRIDLILFRSAGQGESFDVGFDSGGKVVNDAYEGMGEFNGQIGKVEVNLVCPSPSSTKSDPGASSH